MTKKIIKSKNPHSNGHETNTEIGIEAWTNEVDRGGLTHINDAVFFTNMK